MSIVLAEALLMMVEESKGDGSKLIFYERRKPGDLTEGVIHRRMRTV